MEQKSSYVAVSNSQPFTSNRIFCVMSILLDLSSLNKPSNEYKQTLKLPIATIGLEIKFPLTMVIFIKYTVKTIFCGQH